ncbi:MAG: hypothetical protein ACE5IR_04915 [bacterium]
MNCKQVSKVLPDFLTRTLENSLELDLQVHLSTCQKCKNEVDSLAAIWGNLEQIPEQEPGPALHDRFQAMLETYMAGQQHSESRRMWRDAMEKWLDRWWPRQPVFQFGLAVAFLIFGLVTGYQMQSTQSGNQDLAQLHNEVRNLRQLVTTSLLQNQSSSERLRGVSYSYRMERPDRQTLGTLINTLNYDPNLNVRLASIDALSTFYEKPYVRQGLIESLSRQTSPLIQIALINLLVETQEKDAVNTFKMLQNNEIFNQTVRKRAAWALEQLH